MKNSLYLLVLLVLMSCDPGESHERIINNRTNSEIKIYLHHQSVNGYPTDTLVAKPNTVTKLFIVTMIGGSLEPINPMREVDSVSTIIENRILMKNILNSDNWESEIYKHGRGSEHIYTFTVNDEDIE